MSTTEALMRAVRHRGVPVEDWRGRLPEHPDPARPWGPDVPPSQRGGLCIHQTGGGVDVGRLRPEVAIRAAWQEGRREDRDPTRRNHPGIQYPLVLYYGAEGPTLAVLWSVERAVAAHGAGWPAMWWLPLCVAGTDVGEPGAMEALERVIIAILGSWLRDEYASAHRPGAPLPMASGPVWAPHRLVPHSYLWRRGGQPATSCPGAPLTALVERLTGGSMPGGWRDVSSPRGLQAALVDLGHQIEVDGIIGPQTRAALAVTVREHGPVGASLGSLHPRIVEGVLLEALHRARRTVAR